MPRIKKTTKPVEESTVSLQPEIQPEIPQEAKKIRVKKNKVMHNSSGSDSSTGCADSIDLQIKPQKNNKWLVHIREYRKANPEISYKDSLKMAKESYMR